MNKKANCERQHLQSVKCARCGKEFIPAPLHVYKIDNRFYCRYNCYNAVLNEREEKMQKKVQQMIEEEERKAKEKQKATRYKPAPHRQHAEPKNKRSILLYTENGEFVKRYKSQKEAAAETGCSTSIISLILHGERKHAKGYIFKFEEENN